MLLVPQAGFSSADGTPCRKCYLQRFGAGKEFLMELERNELSSLFPSVASQIRSTLTSLHMAAAQLVPPSAREQDPDLDARAARLDQSYYQLLRLVNNLSLAACLTNDQPLPLKNHDLVQLVSQVCAQAAALAGHRGLTLRFVCSLDQQVCAVAKDALEQIVYQLLSNAFKFTPEGGTITVELRRRPGRILISVEDTGCGIPEDRLETLFNRYLHADRMSPPPHGLGLGLSLCHRLAEGHGGALMAESMPGKGSRFTLSLPDRQVEPDVSDIPIDYTGGFNQTLLGLADALPAEAFRLRNQD